MLPSVLSEFCLAQARSICCDPMLVLLPALAVMATAIGNSRRILVRRTWSEPAILWTATVADSGSGKSAAFEAARRPLDKLQIQATRDFEEQMAEYRRPRWQDARYDEDGKLTVPPKVVRPLRQESFLDETTTETVALSLVSRPRGSGIVCEDLREWFGRFDDSKQKHMEEAFYLQAYAGRSAKLIRKSAPKLQIGSAALSIAGTIPQAALKKVMSENQVCTEIIQRFLIAMPPQHRRQWSYDEVPDAIIESYEQMIFRLAELSMVCNEFGESSPQSLELTLRARKKFIEFYNETGARRGDVGSPQMKAASSKLEANAARLALIFACGRYVLGEQDREIVDERDIVAGITASRWFADEAGRIESTSAEIEDHSEQRDLSEWILTHGGSVRISELRRRYHRYRAGDSAERALEALVAAGVGKWGPTETTPQGGRPSRRFILGSGTE